MKKQLFLILLMSVTCQAAVIYDRDIFDIAENRYHRSLVNFIMPTGTADGQLLYWDATTSTWLNSDETKLKWDDGTDILLVDTLNLNNVLEHEYGGLEADVSAYNGLVKISGGSTSTITDSSTNWDAAFTHISSVDDHTQYLLGDGTRDLTGDWTISTNSITLTAGTLTASGLTANKASPSANEILLAVQNNGADRFLVDEDGDFYWRYAGVGTGGAIGAGFIEYKTAGANPFIIRNIDDTGQLAFWTANAEAVRIDTSGNVGIKTTDFGSDGVGILTIGAGTHQTTMGADCASLFVEDVIAGTAELRCMDEGEVETTLSPHNFSLFEPNESYVFPWSYYSRSDIIGKEINVDMYGAIEAIGEMYGKTFIHIRDIPKDEKAWEEKQVFLQTQKQLREEVEITLVEAVEEYEITEPCIVRYETEYKFDPNTGSIVEIAIPIQAELPTGKYAKRFKAGVRLDEKTGKLYRKKRLDDIVIDPNEFTQLPAWMKKLMIK